MDQKERHWRKRDQVEGYCDAMGGSGKDLSQDQGSKGQGLCRENGFKDYLGIEWFIGSHLWYTQAYFPQSSVSLFFLCLGDMIHQPLSFQKAGERLSKENSCYSLEIAPFTVLTMQKAYSWIRFFVLQLADML